MNKIAELRKQKGLNQAQLAEIVHVSQAAISKWEQGTHDPSVDNLCALASYFNVSIDFLTGYMDGKTEATHRVLKEYLTGRFQMQFRESEIDIVDDVLSDMVRLMKERLSK